MFWYWFFVAPALLLAFLSLRGERKRAAYVERRLAENPAKLPPASVIVPVKGPDEGLSENLAALAALDYPDYELIVVARSAGDIPPVILPSRIKIVLAEGADRETGEKVQNLTAAVRAARKRSRILAFADSDGRPTPRWLRALAAPLAEEGVGASTGFRWFTPVPPGFWSLLRSVWDAVSAGLLGPGDNPFAWGGAMAIRKDLFFEARVPEYWKGAVSDDCALSAAVHAAGLRIAYAPGALTPCFESCTARRFFSWARRQLTIIRVYRPDLWRQALVAHIFYCGGMAASAIASFRGSRLAEWALIAQLSPGMLKGFNRAILAKAALPEHEAWFRRHSWVHALWTPLATWMWLGALAASAYGNSIRWRGNRYDLKRRGVAGTPGVPRGGSPKGIPAGDPNEIAGEPNETPEGPPPSGYNLKHKGGFFRGKG
ncbi:MAG: glycosyltransferase [Bryobacteraceae bacterium]